MPSASRACPFFRVPAPSCGISSRKTIRARCSDSTASEPGPRFPCLTLSHIVSLSTEARCETSAVNPEITEASDDVPRVSLPRVRHLRSSIANPVISAKRRKRCDRRAEIRGCAPAWRSLEFLERTIDPPTPGRSPGFTVQESRRLFRQPRFCWHFWPDRRTIRGLRPGVEAT